MPTRALSNKLATAFICALIFSANPYALAETVKVAVCEIINHPANFIGKRVAFHARVESDGIERTILVDDQDGGCRGAIVPISDPNSPPSRAAAEVLNHAIFNGAPGTLDKSIMADFTGVISIGKAEDFMLAPGRKVPVLTCESVENIRVEQIPRATRQHPNE